MTAAVLAPAAPPIAPGLRWLPEHEYHAQAWAMSSSGARSILAPSCPAIAKWQAENPDHKDAWDVGTVTHLEVLGVGPQVLEVEADSWRTKAAKDAREQARADGQVPLLTHQLESVRRMRDAVHAHPLAGALFSDDDAVREHSAWWRDVDSGVECRAMLDWLRIDGHRRPLAVDLKTTTSVAPAAIAKAVANYGYHQQDQWYCDGVASLGVDPFDLGFLFVFVQKEPPHLVTVVQLDEDAAAIGRARNARARETWAACTESGVWPAYSDDIETIALPRWADL